MVDGIDTHAVAGDDAFYEFRISTRCGHDVVILHERAVPACKDLVKEARLMIAGRLVKDLRNFMNEVMQICVLMMESSYGGIFVSTGENSK